MIKQGTNSTRQIQRETRIETRELLRHLMKGKGAIEDIAGKRLHEREVAAYLVKCAKCMWFAANAAELLGLVKLIEPLFFEAFMKAGGDVGSAFGAWKQDGISPPSSKRANGLDALAS